MELQSYQVEFFFDDEETGLFVSSQIDFFYAEDYDSALKQVKEWHGEISAQDYSFVP